MSCWLLDNVGAGPIEARHRWLIVITPGGLDKSPTRFDLESLLTMSEWGEKPLDQQVPYRTLPYQRGGAVR